MNLLTDEAVEVQGWGILRGCKRYLLAVCCVLMLVASCFAASDSSAKKPCRDSVDSYVGYKLSDVRLVTPLAIKTPLSFLFGSQKKFQDEFAAVLAQLALKKGDVFDRAAHNAAIQFLHERYEEAVVSPGERIRIAFVTFRLENCDDAARTVSLTYLVYSSEFLYQVSRIFEKPNDRFTRSLAPGKLTNANSLVNVNGKLLPQPIVGYDRERELFAGGSAQLQTDNGVINEMSVAGTGSANSATADFNLAGSREFTRSRFLSHVDWRVGYNYFNLPSDQNRIKAGTGLAQIFGASKPLGRTDLIFRFGASIEGGNRQSELPVSDPELAQLLGYGALKAYLGATANRGRRSWSASYGLQLSNDGSDASLDYTKHLFDASYRWRYLWREHFPFRLEAQFSGGVIQTHGGPVPVAERFFGGNKIRPFIDGDDWIINSAPFIRSFPQTAFNLVGLNAPFGGEHFFSANLTLSQPVWNFPAVPNEISQESIVRDGIGGALRTARTATVKSYLEEDPQYVVIQKQLGADLTTLDRTLDQVKEQLSALTAQTALPAEVSDAIKEIVDEDNGIDSIDDAKTSIETARTDPALFKGKVRELIVGFKGIAGLIPQLIGTPIPDLIPEPTGLENVLDALRRTSLPVPAKLDESVATLKQINARMAPQVTTLIRIGEVKVDVFKPVMAVVKNDASSDDVDDVVKQIGMTIAEIKTRATTMPGDTFERLDGFLDDATSTLGSLDDFESADADQVRGSVHQLVVGFGELAPPVTASISNEIKKLQPALISAGFATEAQTLLAESAKLSSLQKQARQAFNKIPLNSMEQQADRDIAYAARSLDVIFREINLIEIAPVVTFDAARIGPAVTPGFGKTHYGLGAGVRFSIVTLDFTAGYSFNLNRQPTEPRGAVLLSMTISDLFR